MTLGVNWSAPRHLPVVRSLLRDGHAAFCEIMIDNFAHLPAADIRAALPGFRFAFHIMNSQFLEREPAVLEELAARLKGLASELEPIYISDHLATFRHAGRQFPLIQELDYQRQNRAVKERVALWQEMLGTRVYLENFPSVLDQGLAQPDFLADVARETGAGVLFDFSNAVVAHRNCGLPLEKWDGIIKDARHFHAAGYRSSETDPPFLRDSHDGELSVDTLSFIGRSMNPSGARQDRTLVVERDANVAFDGWAADLGGIRRVLP